MGGGDDVRLGLLTAALPQLSLAEVAGWAADAGSRCRGSLLAGGHGACTALRGRVSRRRG